MEKTVADRLFAQSYEFDFFRAVEILEKLSPKRRPVGRFGSPAEEIVRFRSRISLSFPASSIHSIDLGGTIHGAPVMTVNFMGLTGTNGALPHHYTEMLLRIARESKSAEKFALRDWFDIFNHRIISLLFRAWEKYRFYVPFLRGDTDSLHSDNFTQCLYSLIGIGMPALRNRLAVRVRESTFVDDLRSSGEADRPPLAKMRDLALFYYAGFFAHRPRNAISLESMLRTHFGMTTTIRQFQGQWLHIDKPNQSQIGVLGQNCQLGENLVAGERVWDAQSKFRIRFGPLKYRTFAKFIPDLVADPARKSFFLLCHLVRLYVGPEFDFDVQLVLAASEIPACKLVDDPETCPRLGWNTWLHSQPAQHDAEDVVFEANHPEEIDSVQF